MQEIPFEAWLPGDYREAAMLRRTASDVTATCGISFRSDVEPGLGRILTAGIRLTAGQQVALVQYLQAAPPINEETTVKVLYEPTRPSAMADTIEDLLVELALTPDHLSWLLPEIQFKRHVLWRQDDNGHRFRIGSFSSRSEAFRRLTDFQSLPHKQYYWFEPE